MRSWCKRQFLSNNSHNFSFQRVIYVSFPFKLKKVSPSTKDQNTARDVIGLLRQNLTVFVFHSPWSLLEGNTKFLAWLKDIKIPLVIRNAKIFPFFVYRSVFNSHILNEVFGSQIYNILQDALSFSFCWLLKWFYSYRAFYCSHFPRLSMWKGCWLS